ncbi:flagellar filament capping protein FliD [Sporomusa aerivorans]|uniref:flagellar filament capping protein FliD n=1 Tax=Sporomusa aerivorans TaxID=204936 RepID=UPI00352A95F5
MRWISAVSYNKYFKVYQPVSAASVNKNTKPDIYRAEDTRGSLQVLSNLSINNIKYKQDVYRRQVVDFNTQAKDMNLAAKSVAAGDFFDKKYVDANNRSITGLAQNAANAAEYDVTVSQLAIAQKNTGTRIARAGAGILSAGTYAFGITVGAGAEKTVVVQLDTAESNFQILGKTAAAINEAQPGVKADVRTAGTQAYLSLESEKTGQANAFSIRDITGSVVQVLNLGNRVTVAGDALYSVNGQKKAADKNIFSLDNGNLLLNSNDITAGAVRVCVAADTETMAEGIKDLVTKYNAFSTMLRGTNNITQRGEKTLAGIKAMLTGVREDDFQEFGIGWDAANDQVKLDEGQLARALKHNLAKAESLLSGSTGLATWLQNIAQTALAAPVSSYLKAPNVMDSIDYGWRRSSNRFLFNGFNAVNQGLFLDMVV